MAKSEWQYEERVAVVDKDGTEILYGYADAILYDHERKVAHVVDFKFGWLELPKVMATWQLAALCVGVEQSCGWPTYGHIHCPRTDERYDAPRYEVAPTIEKIKAVIARCEPPDSPLNPNPEACKYCRAQGICPELHKEVELVVRDKCELTPLVRAKRREFLSLVESWAEAVNKEDRAFLLQGGEIPGWELKTRHGPRFISDPYKAWRKLQAYLSSEELMASVKIGIEKLEETFVTKEAEREGGKNQAKALFSAVLGEAIERKPDYVMLARSKAKEVNHG